MRSGDGVEYAKVQANQAGYHADFHDALVTEKLGLSGGVAVTSKWAAGISRPCMGAIVSVPPPHRFVFQHWHSVTKGGIGVGSVYLHATGCLGANNQALLHSIAGYLKAWGRPFVLGGDWQVGPQELEQAGWPAILGAKIVHSNSCTYFSGGHKSQLDYFLD